MGQTHQEVVPAATHVTAKPTDRDICDAYLYLLGRSLVLRQEQLDFRTGDFRWNVLVHRPVGGVSQHLPRGTQAPECVLAQHYLLRSKGHYTSGHGIVHT